MRVHSTTRRFAGRGSRRVAPRTARLAVVLGALAVACPSGGADPDFVRLADLNTLVPGGSLGGLETFTVLSAPSISGSRVAFAANSSTDPFAQATGLFVTQAAGGSVRELVTRRTWLPEYAGPRSGPTAPENAGAGVFLGVTGVFEHLDGRIAFTATTLPSFGVIEHNRSVYAVDDGGTGLAQVYRDPVGTIGGLAVAADRVLVQTGSPAVLHQHGAAGDATVVESGMPVGSGISASFLFPGIDYTAYAGGVAFAAFVPGLGNSIWRRNDTDPGFVLLRRADPAGTPTDAPFPIAALSRLRADTAGSLTFLGAAIGNAATGIFTQRTSGAWQRQDFVAVATTAMPAPLGAGNFKDFQEVAVDTRGQRVGNSGPTYLETDVVFTARDQTNRTAIYVQVDDQVGNTASTLRTQRLIGVGDSLDGRTVTHLQIGRNAVANGNVVFFARFDDGSEAIYSAPLLQLPASGVKATTHAARRWATPAYDHAAGATSADSVSSYDQPGGGGVIGGYAEASAEGEAIPLTGGVRVRAYAYSDGEAEASARVVATQRFVVLGETPGQAVDIDLDFSFSGVMGATGDSGTARVWIDAFLAQPVHGRTELFAGSLVLQGDRTLVRTGAYADPGAQGDVLLDGDPFGDGRDAAGVSILSARTFLSVVQAQVGETLAVEYRIRVSVESGPGDDAAIADFSRTFLAGASSSTPGASLAMIHAVPVPEPGPIVLMIASLVLIAGRVRMRGSRMRGAI